jgi:hypothetical protein
MQSCRETYSHDLRTETRRGQLRTGGSGQLTLRDWRPPVALGWLAKETISARPGNWVQAPGGQIHFQVSRERCYGLVRRSKRR